MVNGVGFPTAVREVMLLAKGMGWLETGWLESGWLETDTCRVLRCRGYSAEVSISYGISMLRAQYT